MNVVSTVMKCRHSVRKFKDVPVDDSIIKDALECAAKAPTARNKQPWIFGVVKNKETLSKIAALAENGKFIADAPVCFAVFGEKNEMYFLEDCCAATENLILDLQAYGIGSCWVAGAKKEYAEPVRLLLGVPDRYTLVSLIPAGCPSDFSITDKKEMKKIVFHECFLELRH
jgi:nitroreductase